MHTDPTIIWSAAKWIGTQLINEVGFLLGVEEQVRSLELDLEYIALHLREADSREEGDDDKLRIFTEQIRQIAFDAEDVVDKHILKFGSSSSTNVCGNCLEKFLRILCNCLDIHFIGKETEAICKRSNGAVERLNKFLNLAPGEGFTQPRPHPKVMQTYPHTEDAYVFGREKDVEDLTERLRNKMEARVMAIVGAGGLGKTTLARKIYNDIRIQNHFKTTAWVTVSQQWDPKDLLSEILRQTKGLSPEERISITNWSEREFVEAINGFLSEKPYLLVLDDMWAREAWVSIYAALAHTGSGSKVIITSRRELDLPLPVDDRCFTHRPRLLNENESLELFNKIALEWRDPQSTVDDGAIRLGREMIKRCDGLPLGVVTLAGLLRTKDASEWEDVSRTFNSIILNDQGPPHYGRSLYQTLTLSYYDLPHYLKPCFLYLASFPEDFAISVKMLARMWIAEGFVTMCDESEFKKSMEDVADQYLNELIGRCMVQVVEKSFTTGKAKKCRLHDLTREFCTAKAKEQCFLGVFSSTNQSTTSTSTSVQVRRASILASFSEVSFPTQGSHLRSLIQFGKELNLKTICKNLKLLRVLMLHGVETPNGCLPEQLGNLKYLRHLALINTNVNTLPEFIGNLSNLLYLEYTLKWNIERGTLTDVVWKMKLLRHLYLDQNVEMPRGLRLDTLSNLQTLWTLNGDCWELEAEIERLSPSIQKLGIVKIRTGEVLDALFRSNCITSGNLVTLTLEWESGKLQNMMPLYEHCNRLRKLKFWGEIDTSCRLQFPPNLVKLDLQESRLWYQDPLVAAGRLGQLKYVYLKDAYRMPKMNCLANSFPQLEELHMVDLDKLEEWSVRKGAMPRLKKLHIVRCKRLTRLPQKLKDIRTLQKLGIWGMPTTFCHRLFRLGEQAEYEYRAGAADGGERGEDFLIIEHIPSVLFRIQD